MDYSTLIKNVNDRLSALSRDYAKSSGEVIINRLNTFATETFSNIEYEIRSEFKKNCNVDIREAKQLFDARFEQIRGRSFRGSEKLHGTVEPDKNKGNVAELETIISNLKDVYTEIKNSPGNGGLYQEVVSSVFEGMFDNRPDRTVNRPAGRYDKRDVMSQFQDSIQRLINLKNSMKSNEDKGMKTSTVQLFEEFGTYIGDAIRQYKAAEEEITRSYLANQQQLPPDGDTQTKTKSLFDYLQ